MTRRDTFNVLGKSMVGQGILLLQFTWQKYRKSGYYDGYQVQAH